MKYLALIIIFLSAHSLACDIPTGKYEAITESEYSLTLELLEEGKYRFVHENWLPGDLHHVGEEHIYKGVYLCKESVLTLKYTDTGEPIVATYKKRSLAEDDLPFDKEVMVLDFNLVDNSKSIMAGWYYWPSKYLKEAFR